MKMSAETGIIFVVSMLCFSAIFLFAAAIPVVSAIDVVILCQRLNRGEAIGAWDWFRTSGRDTFDKK